MSPVWAGFSYPFYLMSLNAHSSWSTEKFWMIENWTMLNASNWFYSTRRPRTTNSRLEASVWRYYGRSQMHLGLPENWGWHWGGGCSLQWMQTCERSTGGEAFFLTKHFNAISLFRKQPTWIILWKSTNQSVANMESCNFASSFFPFLHIIWIGCYCSYSVHPPIAAIISNLCCFCLSCRNAF